MRQSKRKSLLLLLLCLELSGHGKAQSEGGSDIGAGLSKLLHMAAEEQEWIQQRRRELHRIPELSFQEEKTSEYLRSVLTSLNISFAYPVAKTGIVATIGSGTPAVALRSDMDALPIEEDLNIPFKSTHPGRMHACGHDAHMAMLLGAAKILKADEQYVNGQIRLIFQPAEEGFAGADAMISEGVLRDITAIFGIHVFPALESGVIATRTGTIMAASDRFQIQIEGRGGHAAMPHLAVDPVVAASAVVMGLQPLVSRETSPTDAAVISVTRFNTGTGASNVIPDAVTLEGSLRSLTQESIDRLRTRMSEVTIATAQAHGCKATLNWSAHPYPPTVNDPYLVSIVEKAAVMVVGASNHKTLPEPSMAAEDFSFYGQKIPATFSFLGIGNSSLKTDASLHNPRFQMDESQLHVGAALHTVVGMIALDYQRDRQCIDEKLIHANAM